MAEPGSRALNPIVLVIVAVFGGLLVGMIAANVWPILLLKFGTMTASAVELVFLALYVWWFAGGAPGPWREARKRFGRGDRLTGAQWSWGLVAALAFPVIVWSAMVLLFRTIPYPAADFHKGYDFSFIPTLPLQWLACMISALSAGVCEEMGFRGYMQRPLEARFGPIAAILISATLFMLLHLNKSWSLMGMTPIVFGAGVLLGVLARASGTLAFSMLGHFVMDIGLFAYWWTQIAGTFPQRPLSETGLEPTFYLELGVFAVALALLLVAIGRLARLRRPEAA